MKRFSSQIRTGTGIARCRVVFLLAVAVLLLFACGETEKPRFVTLDKILKDKKIVVITRNNANCYYQYRGEAMGFEYDLARAFAEHLGVELSLNIAGKWEGMIPSVLKGEGALIAASMTKTPKRMEKVAFSDGYMKIQQHIIVQRNNADIKTIKDLDGRTIHVRKGTSYQERLEELARTGSLFTLSLVEDIPTEDLIRRVAEKKIEITIADTNIGLLNRRYYPHVVMSGSISGKQYLAWAVHPKATRLRDAVNDFFRTIRANGTFAKIYNQYYADVRFFDYVDLSMYHRRLKSRLPLYKDYIVEAAEKHGFDWRLIAAQVYQESHFNKRAESHAGAYGLMQLTHTVAKSLGVEDIYDPEENIAAGVRHLKDLYDYFRDVKGDDRLYLSLAAYNIGQGHVRDARILAKRKGLSPDKWSSIVKTLPLLKYRKYYGRSGYGYCRGDEPVQYVRQILLWHDILKQKAMDYEVMPALDGRGL